LQGIRNVKRKGRKLNMAITVNGEKIDDFVIEQEAERLRPEYEQVFEDMPQNEREKQLYDWAKENVVERALLNQQAQQCSEQIPSAVIESALAQLHSQYPNFEQLSDEDKRKMREAAELQIKVEHILGRVCRDVPEPSEQAIRNFYDENSEQFMSAEQIRPAHIVKHINWQSDEGAAYEAISSAKKELVNGAAFESLAGKYSDCPDNGGDLGYITRGQMVEEFDDAAFNLGVGEVSDIVRTRFGFHIVKLYDRKPAVLSSFEQVQDTISKELKDRLCRKAVEDFIDQLKDKAVIEES